MSDRRKILDLFEEQNDFISYLRNTDLSKLNFPKSDLYDRKSV